MKLSFLLFGKHIEFVGFIDSGNSLYDSLTKKPVVVASKKSLERYFSKNEIYDIMNNFGRVLECETIGESLVKIRVFSIKDFTIFDEKTSKQIPCVLGVVDKVFENTKYDCLLHRDFI